ncbi:hypothetical protein [Bacteroides stercorirosoris]|uniref:hypothetical protein n=1 Tax=Bacteroides stercorirosoris TaxID=871324 RepID=UPI0011DDAD53|nr:hypothetical protein [Bacteroides stercorirosoris]
MRAKLEIISVSLQPEAAKLSDKLPTTGDKYPSAWYVVPVPRRLKAFYLIAQGNAWGIEAVLFLRPVRA